MIIRDLHPLRAIVRPNETDSELVVDPDAMLSTSVPFQRLQLIPWRNPQRVETYHSVEKIQFPAGHTPDPLWTNSARLFCIATVEDVFRPAVPKRLDQNAPLWSITLSQSQI